MRHNIVRHIIIIILLTVFFSQNPWALAQGLESLPTPQINTKNIFNLEQIQNLLPPAFNNFIKNLENLSSNWIQSIRQSFNLKKIIQSPQTGGNWFEGIKNWLERLSQTINNIIGIDLGLLVKRIAGIFIWLLEKITQVLKSLLSLNLGNCLA